jgi:hypothetical protein
MNWQELSKGWYFLGVGTLLIFTAFAGWGMPLVGLAVVGGGCLIVGLGVFCNEAQYR